MSNQSTSKNFAVLGMASIIVKVLAIVYLPFQYHILGNYGNNIVGKGYAVYTFLFSLSNAGLPNAISKLVAEQAAHKNFRAAQKILKCAYLILLVLGIAVALVMVLGARQLATLMGEPNAYLMLLFFAPTLIFTSVSCALRGYFQGRQNMVPVAVSNIIEQVLNSVFTVVFAYLLIRYGMNYGAAGTTVGTIIGAIGAAVFLCFLFFTVGGKKRRREVQKTDPSLPVPSSRAIYGEITRYSLPAILNTVAACAAGLIDTFIGTQRLLTIGYTEKSAGILFGIYATQYQRLYTLAIAFTTALVTAMIPAVSEALALKNHRLVRHRISSGYKAIYLITMPSICGITFLAKPLIALVFFTAKPEGMDFVVAGTWIAILFTIQSVQTGILLAAGRPIEPSVNLIIGMVFKSVCNYVLVAIPALNLKGAIIGTAVGWTIAIVLNQRAVKKCFPFRIYFVRMLLKPTLAALVMGVCCLGVYSALHALLSLMLPSELAAMDIAVIASVIAGACIYFVVMILIRGVKKEDILRLPFGGRIYRVISKVAFLKVRVEA